MKNMFTITIMIQCMVVLYLVHESAFALDLQIKLWMYQPILMNLMSCIVFLWLLWPKPMMTPQDGTTVILILHQSLHLGNKFENTLLFPDQLYTFGMEVDDVPMHLAPCSKPCTHSTYSPEDNFTSP
jgi:hypothetical protein